MNLAFDGSNGCDELRNFVATAEINHESCQKGQAILRRFKGFSRKKIGCWFHINDAEWLVSLELIANDLADSLVDFADGHRA